MYGETVIWKRKTTCEGADKILEGEVTTMVFAEEEAEYDEVRLHDRIQFLSMRGAEPHPICQESYLINGIIKEPLKGIMTISFIRETDRGD